MTQQVKAFASKPDDPRHTHTHEKMVLVYLILKHWRFILCSEIVSQGTEAGLDFYVSDKDLKLSILFECWDFRNWVFPLELFCGISCC